MRCERREETHRSNSLPVPSQIYALDASLPLVDASNAYQKELLATLGNQPRLDMVVLGMGPDGHTASLFPGHPLLEEERVWVAPIADSPKPPFARITLTLPTLNAAAFVLFVVT